MKNRFRNRSRNRIRYRFRSDLKISDLLRALAHNGQVNQFHDTMTRMKLERVELRRIGIPLASPSGPHWALSWTATS